MSHDHWNLGRWAGIPVAMHWTLLLNFAWLYLLLNDLIATAIAAATLFVLFVAHEFGHVVLLRWRRIKVEDITFNGLHGRTTHECASHLDAGIAAWGGVLAQLALLLASLVAQVFLAPHLSPLAWTVFAPVLFVLIKLNIFLLLLALLPIGPFDGREAWAGLPYMRTALRRFFARKKEPVLSAEQRRELELKSETAAADLLRRVGKKADGRKEDA